MQLDNNPKLALHFICKNEEHVINSMLNSAKGMTDMIVALDTGSTDNTISAIREFGKSNSIPTFVYERPFDNFSNSRNCAYKNLKEEAIRMGWDLATSYGFWIDCDEQIVISPTFSKKDIDKQILFIRSTAGTYSYTKTFMFNLSVDIEWEGPVHETPIWSGENVETDVINGIKLLYGNKGASWKGDQVQKYMGYANKLATYIKEGHKTYRWYYYLSLSYSAAAHASKSNIEKTQLLEKSEQCLGDALSLNGNRKLEKFMLLYRLAESKKSLSRAWETIQGCLLQAFSIEKSIAEPINAIVEHYIETKDWHKAYLFSEYSYQAYVSDPPVIPNISETQEILYQWKLLYHYYLCCYHTNRKDRSIQIYKQLKKIIRQIPEALTTEDIWLIRKNSPLLLKLRRS